MTSVSEILDAICDERSLKLFNTIATNDGNSSNDLLTQLRLSRKEYYSRMSRLTKIGIVKRKSGEHFLTAFGMVVFEAQATIRKAVENNWKLKAIDSIISTHEISTEERKKLLDTLMDDSQIKTLLLENRI
jgi:hypothetical protein